MKEKILITLSDANLTSVLVASLTKEGYQVTTAKTGDEAMQKMKDENPALLLIDLVLPGKSGYDTLAEKTLDRFITKIPVLIVSNVGDPIDMKRIPSTPTIKGYIIKAHVDPVEVTQKVAEAFGRPVLKPAGEITFDVPSDAKPAPAPKHISRKVLWVEDDKFLSMILVKKFQTSGHTLFKANDGIEALKILETETPDVIVLDIMLPGMDGFEILQKIKMDERLRNVPVMMLSNLSKPGDIEKTKTLGAQKFLVKAAVSLDEIIREVEALVK